MEQVSRGHDSAREEVLTHPVAVALLPRALGVGLGVVVLEAIGVRAVGKDMSKEPAFVMQPGTDSPQQLFPVSHVLEHLNGHNSVEPAQWHSQRDSLTGIKLIHIASHDF